MSAEEVAKVLGFGEPEQCSDTWHTPIISYHQIIIHFIMLSTLTLNPTLCGSVAFLYEFTKSTFLKKERKSCINCSSIFEL